MNLPIKNRLSHIPSNKLTQNKGADKQYNVNTVQPQNHELNLTAISTLKLTLNLLMVIFTEINYSLLYNTVN